MFFVVFDVVSFSISLLDFEQCYAVSFFNLIVYGWILMQFSLAELTLVCQAKLQTLE